jgi:GH15 family glucan-1,4-alpha-glucosidase
MAKRIEDYGVVGDTQAVALVGHDAAVDWLCLPRFDSRACFAALLGDERHGSWSISPRANPRPAGRRYRDRTLVLETDLESDEGAIRVIDFMPPRGREPDLVRIVEGLRGRVAVRSELRPRFDYGFAAPWIREAGGTAIALAGPDAVALATSAPIACDRDAIRSDFAIAPGERVAFVLAWFRSHERVPGAVDPDRALATTEAWWREWCGRCTYGGRWREAVERSLITLKALTYAPTGGIVAAATTSLPEKLGGVRNWDYRFCWLRDATFTLYALVNAGYTDEAAAWREWLLRAVAGDPRDLQIMYGPAGERRLTEVELEWLPGYEGSRPVRIGNAAHGQRQLDVFGELMDAMHQARRAGLEPDVEAWELQRRLLEHLESAWREPDEGIWEVRGPRRHFTHSKVMAWVALDRAVKAVETIGLDGPAARWRRLAKEIHAEVCRQGYDADLGSFVQYYGSKRLDASLLMVPLVGFLPIDDDRVVGTIAAIRSRLCRDGFVERYAADEEGSTVDGLPPGEGAFLPCTFWLADALALLGRTEDATRIFERLLALRNDLGLLSEEYDPERGRLLGNFPQAFTHVGLLNTAHNLERARGPAEQRGREEERESRSRGSA